MINKAGELIDHIIEAVESHGCTPASEVRVRLGALGPIYRIRQLNGVKDQRGFSLLLELSSVPEEV